MNLDANSLSKLTIISALDRIQNGVRRSELTEYFFSSHEREFRFLKERLDLSRMQAVVLAILCETGDGMSWRDLAEFIGVSRLSLMNHSAEVEAMVERRWLKFHGVPGENGMCHGFSLPYGIIKAFRHGEAFVPENIDNLTEQQFINRLVRYVRDEGRSPHVPMEENQRYMLQLCDHNSHLPLCREVLGMEDESESLALLALAFDYNVHPYFAGYQGMDVNGFDEWLDDFEADAMAFHMRSGSSELFEKGIVEHAYADGLVDNSHVRLTEDAIRRLLGECTPRSDRRTGNLAGVVKPEDIVGKTLLYNREEELAVDRLKALFMPESLDDVRRRLKESGMRAGIACLFYGAPGTGKTETALQLARLTGRQVMQVDIAGMRDKYVGESEKNIKAVFKNYRRLCRQPGPMPILLFNEADALINTRFERVSSSVERMDNAMQNIILQELETLEGILIATTNLTASLDTAFERRFLFKVQFKVPEPEVRARIWHAMMPELDEADCKAVARTTELSGGQIENVARKCRIEYAITGNHVKLPQLLAFCREERLHRGGKSIGFR